jgi:hypothetical protein
MATGLNRYLTEGAIEGFVATVAPLTALGYAVKIGPAGLNDVVRVPYAQNVSASYAFDYTNGYANNGNTIVGKAITLNSLMYQRIALTDSDLIVLNQEAITRIGNQAGRRLATDVISASLATILTDANFPNSGSNSMVATFTSSVGLAALDKLANDSKWANGERSLICDTTLWQNLMINTTIFNASYFGTDLPVKQGRIEEVIGFYPYKCEFTLPNSTHGIATNPNGILFANGYHQPQDYDGMYVDVQEMRDAGGTGLTIGFRQFYDPLRATNVRVFDCLSGVGVGDGNGVIQIK